MTPEQVEIVRKLVPDRSVWMDAKCRHALDALLSLVNIELLTCGYERKFIKSVPGSTACHAIISDQCRRSRTDAGAFDEAVSRLRQKYEYSCSNWEIGMGAKIHLVLSIERPNIGAKEIL